MVDLHSPECESGVHTECKVFSAQEGVLHFRFRLAGLDEDGVRVRCANAEVSSVPAEVVDAKTSAEGSPFEFLFMFLLALPRCFTMRLISHARAHCRLPRGPVCGGMGGMPGWSCHFNGTATHIAPVRTQHAPNTGTTTYAQKSWGGHPRCDLAPLTTSFGTVGQWERQHLTMAATTSPEVVGWAPPRCDLAPQSTSFGTVALRERQHLAMAGSRHLHSPRYATAHRAARANYHVPRWRSGLAVPASCWSTWIPEGFRRMSSSAAVLLAYRRSRLFAVVFTRAFQRDCALRGFCSSSIARATTMLVRAACKIPTISSALLGETMVFFHGVLSVISLWLETIISLFPCCLPLRAVRLW